MRDGLDVISPHMQVSPGACLAVQNYYLGETGGYARINGYERYDGRPSPSEQHYYTSSVTVTGAIAVGDTVTGATSGKTAKVIAISGGTLTTTKNSGTFTLGENLNVSGTPQATLDSLFETDGEDSPVTDNAMKELAADVYRADIAAVPGSGDVLGVWSLNGTVYAVRNNAGGTAAVIHKATASGWSAITMLYQASMTLWRQAVADDTAIVGHTSGATATLRRQLVRTGSYGSTATGSIVTSSATGSFTAGETIRSATLGTFTVTIATPAVFTKTGHGLVAGDPVLFTTTGALPTGLTAGTTYYVISSGLGANTFQVSTTLGGAAVNTSGTQSGTHSVYRSYGVIAGNVAQIALSPSGSYKTVNYNFTGASNKYRTYGCDGVNQAFEFDGTYYVPIPTGMTVDTPSNIAAHKNFLFLSFVASVQYSSVLSPYSWSTITGAGEIAVGDTVTGLMSLTKDALAISTSNTMFVLYGSGSSDFQLDKISNDGGAFANTLAQVGSGYYQNANGIMRLGVSQDYGNFSYSAISKNIRAILDSFGTPVASCTHRGYSQYRIAFDGVTGSNLVVMTSGAGSIHGFTTLVFPAQITCMASCDFSGEDRVFFGAADGYVYEMDKGNSFDGSDIEAFIKLHFNSERSPRTRKFYRRVVWEITADGYCTLKHTPEFSFGNLDVSSHRTDDGNVLGAGGYWDVADWDEFYWDAAAYQDMNFSIAGTGTSVSLNIYSKTKYPPHRLTGAYIHYTIRRNER